MFFVFFLLWIIFNGRITVEITLFGIVISAVMYAFICKYMDYSFQKDKNKIKTFFLGAEYIIVLIWEIIVANIHVIHLILTPKYEIEPIIIHFKTDLKKESSKALLANSITLTPGTITVMLEGDEYVVHCLDKELAEGIEHSKFVRMLQKMESR